MFIHPSLMIFLMTNVSSIMMIIASNNMLIMWTALEINMLSFLPLLINKSKYSAESSVKYFMIQAIGSIMFLLSTLSNNDYMYLLMLLSILLKMGVPPMHQWLISMTEALSWDCMFLLMTLQKLPSILIMLTYNSWGQMTLIMVMALASSSIIGPLGSFIQNSLRKILMYSSISNMAWMLSAMYMNQQTFYTFFALYTFINLSLIFCFKKNQLFSLNQLLLTKKNLNSNLMFLNMLSLAGMPPLIGFLPKIVIMKEMLSMNMTLMASLLLWSTLMMLFIYLRLSIISMLTSFNLITKKNIFMSKKEMLLNLLFVLSPPLFFW